MPEKQVVFTGSVSVGAEASAETSSIDLKVRIMYPMDGGTALVTFEDEEGMSSISPCPRRKSILLAQFLLYWQVVMLNVDSSFVCYCSGSEYYEQGAAWNSLGGLSH